MQQRRGFLGIAMAMVAAGFHAPGRPEELRAPALSRKLQMQLVDQVSVFEFMSEAEREDVRTGTGSVDVTRAVQACLDAVAGKHRTVRFPAGTYLMSRSLPRSHTILWMDGATVLKKAPNGRNLLRPSNAENVHILANGARLDGSAPDEYPSHTVYFESSRNCSIRDANVVGAGARKDCIYVGEGTQGPSQDVQILGGSCVAANRNGISVVSALRTVIDGVEIRDAIGAPGAGIDVEANEYDRALDTEIRNCRIHGNQSFGIVVVFGHGVKIHHNVVYDNLDGIGAGAGGVQYKPGVYRRNVDVRGVARFSPATGRVLVGGRMESLPVGSIVLFTGRNGASPPATFRGATRWIVNEVIPHGDQLEVVLAVAQNHGILVQLSDAGSGRMHADPDQSDVWMLCQVEGQCSNVEIYQNRVYGNRRRGMSIGTGVNFSIRDNDILHGGSMSGMQVSYMRATELKNNTVRHDGSAGGTAGIIVAACTSLQSRGNRITGFPESGLDLARASGMNSEDDMVVNSGAKNGVAVRIRYASGMKVSGLKIRTDANHPVTYGIQAEAVTESTFSGIDSTGAGRTNANSINVGRNMILNSRVRDGSAHPSRPSN